MKNSKKTFLKSVLISALVSVSINGFSQVGIGTTTPSNQSLLDLTATDKGLLIPRLTTALRTTLGTALTTAADVNNKGMQVFDTDTNTNWFWDGTAWVQVIDVNSSSRILATNGMMTSLQPYEIVYIDPPSSSYYNKNYSLTIGTLLQPVANQNPIIGYVDSATAIAPQQEYYIQTFSRIVNIIGIDGTFLPGSQIWYRPFLTPAWGTTRDYQNPCFLLGYAKFSSNLPYGRTITFDPKWFNTSNVITTTYKPILDNSISNSALITAIGRYIVPATGLSNGFVGQANNYVDYNGYSLSYSTPVTGDKATILGGTNVGVVYTYNGSAWVKNNILSNTTFKPILDNSIADSATITAAGRYIVPAAGLANGFIGQANKYADYDGTTFNYSTPSNGEKITVLSGANVGSIYTYTGGVWLQNSNANNTVFKPILENTITDSAAITGAGRYIVPTTGLANGFTGQANKYADYDGTTFTYTTPSTGDKITVLGGTNIGVVYTYNGSAWVKNNILSNTVFKPILENTITDSAAITGAGRYIVPATGLANGFIGQANKYADYDGTTFTYTTPLLNDKITIETGTNIGYQYTYSGTAWVKKGQTTPLPTDNYLVTNAYNINDLVIKDSKIYQANAAVPANTTFAIGTSGATWKRISQVTQWALSSSYLASELVYNNNQLFEANGDISANTLFTKGTSGATWKQISGIPEWTYAGTVTILATGSSPNIPTTSKNAVYYKQIGFKTWQIELVLETITASGANTGSGDYILTLPNGLAFDTSLQTQIINNSNLGNTGTWVSKILANSSAMISRDGSGSRGSSGGIIPYSTNQYRVYLPTDSANQCWGSSWFQFGSGTNMEIKLNFTFQSAN